MIHRLTVLLMLAAASIPAAAALAQGGQAAAPADDSVFPPVNGAAPTASIGAARPSFSFVLNGAAPGSPTELCTNGFVPLREDAERKGQTIKAASARHAPPGEACKIIGDYSAAEVKMIKYVEANAAQCGIQASVLEQLKTGHGKTEGLKGKICAIAAHNGTHGIPGQINDFGDPAFEHYRF